MSAQRASQKTVRPHGFGWMPDLPDQRDYRFGAIYKIPAKLPASVDLRSLCSPVEDQGTRHCTANALPGHWNFRVQG
jgi:hypothetical protein